MKYLDDYLGTVSDSVLTEIHEKAVAFSSSVRIESRNIMSPIPTQI
jgi:hypothetical protein